MIHFDPKPTAPGNESSPSVCAIGIGGAGCNILDRLALGRLPEAELVSMSADVRVLNNSMAQRKVQLGPDITRGLGAGGDPELGRQLAEATSAEIGSAVERRSIVLVCVGLGGGTGSGVAPYVVEQARAAGAFVVVFAVLPFPFEGRRRSDQANVALAELERAADVLVTFENARMGELALPKEGIQGAFAAADDTLGQSIRAVAGIVLRPGIIRIGLDDLTAALRNKGSRCLFGYGEGAGDARATDALHDALKSPLLDNGQNLRDASTVLAHVAGGSSMSLYEVELVMSELAKHVSPDAQLLFGTGTDKALGEKMVVTLVSSLGVVPEVDEAAESTRRAREFLEPETENGTLLKVEATAEPEAVEEKPPAEHGESVAKALAAITAAVSAPGKPDAQYALDFSFEPETEDDVEAEEPPAAEDLDWVGERADEEAAEVVSEIPREIAEEERADGSEPEPEPEPVAGEEAGGELLAEVEHREEPVAEAQPVAGVESGADPAAEVEIEEEVTERVDAVESGEDPDAETDVEPLVIFAGTAENAGQFEETEADDEIGEEAAGFGEALLQNHDEEEEFETRVAAPGDEEEELNSEPDPFAYEPEAEVVFDRGATLEYAEEAPSAVVEDEEFDEADEASAAHEDSDYEDPAYEDVPDEEPVVAAAAPVGVGQGMLEFGHAASPGRFQNADPTIAADGDENLDIPTFLRRRMAKG